MERHRWILLVAAPGPILLGSMVLSRACKPGVQAAVATNEVLWAQSAAAVEPPRDADLQRQCETLARQVAEQLGPGCEVVVHAPFVLGGDLAAGELERWRRETIAPAAAALQKAYFDRPPHEPVTVLLFANEQSYQAQAQRLFGDQNISVYGYYKPNRRTLVMNISTGGGTLVHELTHALVDFDFPEVPEWFNEGLASLHEQCRFRPDGSGLDGLVNWRFPILRQALDDGELESLETLIATDDFRGPREAVHYAQARYLCLYLQEQGLLEEFFRSFRDRRKTDPRGGETLRAILGGRDWPEIDADFRAWVREKKYEG